MTIKFELKTVYGNELFYPMCDKAHIMVSLTSKKTLNSSDISKIESLGFNVEIYFKSGSHYMQIKRSIKNDD